LLRLGFFVVLCCVFAGLLLIAQRRLTEPFTWADDLTLPHHEVRCAPQQNSLSIGSYGSKARITAPQHCCPLHLNEQTPTGRVQCRRYVHQ
jgi:hypothetical protein